ncbi:MAG: hypothetical protein EOO94_01615, partial [Pedobacter sp.]
MKKFLLWVGLLSAAINLSAQSKAGDYRPRANGNWNDPVIWQRHDGVSWQPATTYPRASDNIITITRHIVTYNITDAVDELVVAADG